MAVSRYTACRYSPASGVGSVDQDFLAVDYIEAGLEGTGKLVAPKVVNLFGSGIIGDLADAGAVSFQLEVNAF